jgi:transcriptional regulator with XRE-family HTH domain
MKKIPQYIIDKAIELRIKHKMTVPEIAECLGYSKSTVNGWMENYPLEERTTKQTEAQKAGTKANQDKAAALRQADYDEAWKQAPELMKDRRFRDFICMYIGEGTKKMRNMVAIANSNAKVMKSAYYWMEKLRNHDRQIEYLIQIHVDQDEQEIKDYWAKTLGINSDIVKTQRKSNSGQLSGRNFRSLYGVLTIRTSDTAFRSRLEAWMNYVLEDMDSILEDYLDNDLE